MPEYINLYRKISISRLILILREIREFYESIYKRIIDISIRYAR